MNDELESIKFGRKPISVFRFALSDVHGSDVSSSYDELVRESLQRDLEIAHFVDRSFVHDIVCVFVLRRGEEWRVQALFEVWRASRRHPSDELSYLESSLLGYSDADVLELRRYQHQQRSNAKGLPVLVLLDGPRVRELAVLGMRALSSSVVGDGLYMFSHQRYLYVVKDPAEYLPQGTVLGRLCVAPAMFDALFRLEVSTATNPTGGAFLETTFTSDRLEALNRSLTSHIELFSDGQWT